ncbi:hypothetical protein G6M26_10335 [Agrobacterium tumefaciens]|nr:hypothetical protein [Agrobacterium tumefaciens]NTE18917.1 hypothetical protein [Agrobacterium tumefaciens]
MTTIHWFSHSHENRNDWLRFGLMQLAIENQVKFNFWDLDKMVTFGFSPNILTYPDLRHKSFILVENGLKKTKCLVDSEDSFVLFSELIEYVDIYFCAGYNSDVFVHKRFPRFYTWQTEADLNWYKEVLTEKIDTYQQHFYKVRKFIPIAPNLWKEIPLTKTKRFWLNIADRLRKFFNLPNHYEDVYQVYQSRYQDLLKLRNDNLRYDITLNDTSWGWPLHRIKLHQILRKLADGGFAINSILNYGEPSPCDNSDSLQLKTSDFPMSIGSISDYEQMLASSKLGVFACGFHWGWRNILSLALFIGLPVITDRLLTEAYFNLNTFKIWETEDEEWILVQELLTKISTEEWTSIKEYNQERYDKLLKPEAVANYFIRESLN